MKKYFYSNGQEKEGPVSLDELKLAAINPRTLIWYEGLDDWKVAESIEELTDYFELTPPPIENDCQETKIIQSIDSSHKSNSTYVKSKQKMFSNPASFDGRIRRMEYGLSFMLFVIVVVFVNILVKSGEYPIISLVNIPLYWFIWAQGAKRCHDLGKNGWYQIIPLYVFWLIFAKGLNGINIYGRNPKNE